jgi:hypothetical protein
MKWLSALSIVPLNDFSFRNKKTSEEKSEEDRSDYDGRRLNTYTGVVNGRRVTVHSSWRPGDPDR